MELIKILFLTAACSGLSERIYFEKCGQKRFICGNSLVFSGKQDVTYRCKTNYKQDITFYLWQFSAPFNIGTLLIKDCHTIQFYFGCTAQKKDITISRLHLQNITNLEIIPAALSHNPQIIHFENITNIKTIPRNTFSQIQKKQFKPGCYTSNYDLHTIIFQNVNIGTIETEAFENLTNMKMLYWQNVSVFKIDAGGVKIKTQNNFSVQVLNSTLKVLEPLAIQVVGANLIVLRNKFSELSSGAITGDLGMFELSYNSIKSVQSGAFSLLANNVDIVGNYFEHLHSGAFQKISSNSKSTSIYNFRQNLIKYADVGGLHPDISAYRSKDVTFANNSLYCTCEGLAWLGAEANFGFGYSSLKSFHKMVLDSQNNNTCAFVLCNLPLVVIKDMILSNGKCRNLTVVKQNDVCAGAGAKFEDNLKSALINGKRSLYVDVLLMLVCVIFKLYPA